MARARTIVFLDIDGVLSIEDPVDPAVRRERWPGCGPAWPIPFADMLVRVLDHDPRVRPVWLSYWERRAWRWNDRAGTRHWPVAFPPNTLGRRLPMGQRQGIDGIEGIAPPSEAEYRDEKLLAVWTYLIRWPGHPALWIEDGFWPETVEWVAAYMPNLRLIDATLDDIYAVLVADHADPNAAARAFLDACLAGL